MFKYRKRSPIGGLAANLEAEFDESPGHETAKKSIVIHKGIKISPPLEGAYWKDFCWMTFGLSLHGESLSNQFPRGAVFNVLKFEFPLADYRPEVAALTVDSWLVQEYGFPASGIGVSYDPTYGDYVFDWGGAQPFVGQ